MSEYIRITKEGMFEHEWDPETRTWPATKVEKKVVSRLRNTCKIDPDVTLRDIFELVASSPELLAFFAEYSWCRSISEFHEQARQPGPQLSGIEYLEIVRHIAISTSNWEGKPDVEMPIDFGGVGKDGTHYSCSLTPMNQIAHLPLRLNLECKMFMDHKLTGTYATGFSLLDVLDTIYDDISFHGSPKETEEVSRELVTMMEDIKAGRAETTPWEPDEETVQ